MDGAAEALLEMIRPIAARRLPVHHQDQMSQLDNAAAVLSVAFQCCAATPEGRMLAHEPEALAYLLGTVLVTQSFGSFQVGPIAEAFARGILDGHAAVVAAQPAGTRQ